MVSFEGNQPDLTAGRLITPQRVLVGGGVLIHFVQPWRRECSPQHVITALFSNSRRPVIAFMKITYNQSI